MRNRVWGAVVALSCAACWGACSSPESSEAGGKGFVSAGGSCGNGVLDPGEQCDDGNLANLDGCNATCHVEQVQRVSALTVVWGPDAFCPLNALGSAFKSVAHGTAQGDLNAAVKDGSLTILFQVLGLSDPKGGNQSFSVGALTGAPAADDGGFDGTSDLDGWYTAFGQDVNLSGGLPLAQLGAVLDGGVLTAGPGAVSLPLSLGDAGVGLLQASSVLVKGNVGPLTAPTLATTGRQGHRSSEHLSSTYETFASVTGGELCGWVSAASLATLPALPEVIQGGSEACSQGYTAANSLLDVLVGGCKVLFITGVNATQPDQVAPGVATVGAGGPYQLQANAQRVVSSCTDKTGASVPLADCLAAAAYSGAVQFSTTRAIITGVQ